MTTRIADREERELRIDHGRVNSVNGGMLKPTGILVPNVLPPNGCNPYPQPIDLVFLDSKSLHRHLRSKGGRNDLAEDIVRHILGHPPGERPD